MGFDWTDFGNNLADVTGATAFTNVIGATNTGAGGFSGNSHYLGNRIGQDANKVIDTGEHVLDSGQQATKNMADAMKGVTNMLKGLTNMDPTKIAIGAVVVIVIMKI